MITRTFPYAQVAALALAAHEAAFAERGERYATPEEMAMHRAEPLGCDELVWPQVRAALGISDEFGRGYCTRVEGDDVIAFDNLWADEAPAPHVAQAMAEIRARFDNEVECLDESVPAKLTGTEVIMWGRSIRIAGANRAAGKTCRVCTTYAIHPDGYWEAVGLESSSDWV